MCESCQKHQEEADARLKAEAMRAANSVAYAAHYTTHVPPGSTINSVTQYTMMQRLSKQEMMKNELNAQDAGNEHYEAVGGGDVPTTVIPSGFDTKEPYKDDSKKTDLSLLPYRPLSEIAEVLEFGERKYDRDNWRKGFKHERLLAALLRHIFAYNEGETNDPETGLCHLAHAGCMLLFLMETRHTHPELDYRRMHGTT